ncbi:MAG: hypothetical protein KKA73_25410 [Chloroflexi bacterium]|nr:hypothetical protein [Chloroflexota bacterium]MBU1751035.1 hypothetical protein [Chloroflexota bacterium]
MELFAICCPECGASDLDPHTTYIVLAGEQRRIYHCPTCGAYFSETKNTPLAGLRTRLSRITTVLDALNDGMGVNAACRTCHGGQNSR